VFLYSVVKCFNKTWVCK